METVIEKFVLCMVWRGQTEREPPFLNLKGQPALLIIVGLAAALRVLCRKCCQQKL